MEWTDERTDTLKTLWLQGQTASQIAEQLGGITRNAVIGKAHRLGLSSRPSPIRHRPARPAPQPGHAAAAPAARPPQQQVAPPRAHAPIPQPAPPRPVKAAPGSRACMWPMGDPKQPDFHFCGAPADIGRPYCPSHCAVAYHRKTDAAA